jgi:hypothetical protein
MRGRRKSLLMGSSHGSEIRVELSLPPVKEVGDGAWVHIAHVSEFGDLLRVDEIAFAVEDGKSGNSSLLERDLIFFRYVQVLIVVADVDVNEEKVLVEEFKVWTLMEIDLKNLAVAAPVATKGEDDPLVFEAGLLDCCIDVGLRISLCGVEMLVDRGRRCYQRAC